MKREQYLDSLSGTAMGCGCQPFPRLIPVGHPGDKLARECTEVSVGLEEKDSGRREGQGEDSRLPESPLPCIMGCQ